jgi:type VI protein secretion system component Hcp
MASDFFLKFDDFHKFESFEDAAEEAARDLRRLGANSVDLGGGFLRLIRDGSFPSDSPAAATVDLKFKHDDAFISDEFFKLGSDFVSASETQHKVNIKEIPIIKVIDKSSPILSAVSDGGGDTPKVVTDLLNYEADLKITGLDFFKIAQGIADAPAETLSLNFNKISVDYKEQSADLMAISEDFIALAKNAEQFKIRGLSDAFLAYAEDAHKLADGYLKVSADYLKISQDFVLVSSTDAVTTGGEIKFNQVVLQNSDDFIKWAGDLKFIKADFDAIAGDTIKLSNTLETAAHQLLPAVQKGG